MLILNQTFECVCGLLKDLPGITLLGGDLNDGEARFEVVAAGPEAIHSLVHLSLGANVVMLPAIRPSQPDASTRSQKQFGLVANTAKIGEVELGQLQLLAIHLVWHLHKIGLVATSHANILLQTWRGAAVGV